MHFPSAERFPHTDDGLLYTGAATTTLCDFVSIYSGTIRLNRPMYINWNITAVMEKK